MKKRKKDKMAVRTRKRKLWLAQRVAMKLGVSRANYVLFPALAQVLGKAWIRPSAYGDNFGKAAGYAMVEEYAQQEGILYHEDVVKHVASIRSGGPRLIKAPTIAPVPLSDDFLMSYEWRRLRMVVIKKRGARCECCGASPSDGQTVINVDHVKPRKLFPELALVEENLQVLCSVCNHGKGNWDQTDWRTA